MLCYVMLWCAMLCWYRSVVHGPAKPRSCSTRGPQLLKYIIIITIIIMMIIILLLVIKQYSSGEAQDRTRGPILGPKGPLTTREVTLMRPVHGSL